MGDAPKILEQLCLTREQLRERELRWFMDNQTGQIAPEVKPEETLQVRPFQAAYDTWD